MADRTRSRRRKAEAEPPGPDAALEIGVRFLAARPRTRYELERRLRRAGAQDATVETTLQRLGELGYLDDAAFARWWGEQRDRHAPRGRRLIEAELRRSGVPSDVIESYRDEHADPVRALEDVGLPGTEEERASEALFRHLRGRPVPDDPKARQRIGMFLMRRGFDSETVCSAMRAAGAEVEEPSSDG